MIDPARPSVFGFIDHDLFPLAPCDPFAALASRPVAGDKRWAGGRWFLWAGYCFFRTEALSGRKVSFGQDWFIGLDTGGGNWRSNYRHLDPATIAERPIELIPVVPPGPTDNGCLEHRGEWLHEAGSSWSPD